ncbi:MULTISPECIES: DUF3291 domain-containing protein [unclassified Nocardiopsis]|uniref:DUF3291 domain-containing protein n=1 Tax=unclassified Nocardiopsis TaxID=2649073 RepID=UPI00135A6B21|nr:MULTISPECIES: DUF3291 domain-containing protein [unclassified Nocardiopsis]
MSILIPHQHAPVARQPHRSGEGGRGRRGGGPVLAEARTVRGDRRFLGAFAAVLRERARAHPGHLEEVHFADEGDHIRFLVLWRSTVDLRAFVEEAHRDVLALRERAGAFPEVERVLWWAADGAPVPPEEAAERARRLRERGPGADAFTLASPVPVPS